MRLLDGARQAAERGAISDKRLLAFARRQELKLEAIELQNPDPRHGRLSPANGRIECRDHGRYRRGRCADRDRRQPARACADEPGGECARCNAKGRLAEHRCAQCHQGPQQASVASSTGGLCPRDCCGYRGRHGRGHACAGHGALLHHPGGREGDGSRPLHGSAAWTASVGGRNATSPAKSITERSSRSGCRRPPTSQWSRRLPGRQRRLRSRAARPGAFCSVDDDVLVSRRIPRTC